jgi:hypothetical protein
MIVRILGEAQRAVPDDALDDLDQLDQQLVDACEAGEHDTFAAALTALLARVREVGAELSDDAGPSELVLPSADASLAEVGALLTDGGLISR